MRNAFIGILAALVVVPTLAFATIPFAQATTSANKLGHVYLAVEGAGELWYVRPSTGKRVYFATPYHVSLFMKQGVGISNADLAKIPIGVLPENGVDTDGDGLPDSLEWGLNISEYKADTDEDNVKDGVEILNHTNPKGAGVMPLDKRVGAKLAGRIVLQVQDRGQAWYVEPKSQKRYYLGTPQEAFNTLAKLAIGITNQNLALIPIE